MKNWTEFVPVNWEENFLQLDTGIRMCYLTAGPENGSPIVLIHGATDSRVSWSQIAPLLAEQGCRVYVPELRGHGKTDKPIGSSEDYFVPSLTADVLNFMDKAGIARAALAGHSIGTFIAMRIAAEHPERVSGLFLLAAGLRNAETPLIDWLWNGDGEFMGITDPAYDGGYPDSFLRDWATCANETEGFEEAIFFHVKTVPAPIFRALFEGLRVIDQRELAKKVTAPVHIFWGTEDAIFPASAQEEILAYLTNAASLVKTDFPGIGHNLHWEGRALAEQLAGIIAKEAGANGR